jgi:uncharacterized Zn-finger protein
MLLHGASRGGFAAPPVVWYASDVPYHFEATAAIFGAQNSAMAKARFMAHFGTPHFANDVGAEKIFVGVKELQCMGARPPYDHPHVFLDMGADGQILCPYCSTLYIYDARLAPTESDPKSCLVNLADELVA